MDEEKNTDINAENENITSDNTPQAVSEEDPYAKYAQPERRVEWEGSAYSGRPAAEYSAYRTQENGAPENSAERGSCGANEGQQYENRPEAQQYENRPDGQGHAPHPEMLDRTDTGDPYPVKEKKKRHMPKVLSAILLGLLFGVVAAGTFYGGTKLIGLIEQKKAERAAADTVTTAEKPATDDVDRLKTTKLSDKVYAAPADVSDVIESVLPSVVQMNCITTGMTWFGTYQQSPITGSGIIIGENEKEYLIGTNSHVVQGASSISVTFCDGGVASAVLKGNDEVADLAVVAVSKEDVPEETVSEIKVAILGDSDSVKPGQMSVVIGNALGYGTSAAVGYISAVDREIEISGTSRIFIQTTAAINPGNSGGALINTEGEVIGIPSARIVSSTAEDINFAIPITRAFDILAELGSREILKDNEKGYIGITMKNVTEEIAQTFGWPQGVYIDSVVEGLPAEKAGLLPGDIITAIDGKEIVKNEDAKTYITSKRVGTEVTITVQRLANGKFEPIDIKVVLGSDPQYDEEQAE